MIHQLNPPLPVDTPRGPAYAHLVIDYSQEHYLLFVCFLLDSGECWTFPNREVKLQANPTMGVRVPSCSCAAGHSPRSSGSPAASPA